MKHYYSLIEKGFYVDVIHGSKIPADAIQVTADQKAALFGAVNAGKSIDYVDGDWVIKDASPPSLDDVRQNQIVIVNEGYESACAGLKQGMPMSEILTWDIQKIEAEAWAMNPVIATPFCDGIAGARGMDRQVFLEKVLAKVAAYNQHISLFTGLRQRCEDRIMAAETIADIYAVVWDGVKK